MYNDSLVKLILIANEYSPYDKYAWITEGCQYFSQKLDDAGIPNVLLTYRGGHRQDDQFRITMLPLMASCFQFDPDYLNNEAEVYSMNVDYFKACDIDSLNREVIVTVTEQDRLTINTEDLTRDLYILKLVSSDRISMHKIIMQ